MESHTHCCKYIRTKIIPVSEDFTPTRYTDMSVDLFPNYVISRIPANMLHMIRYYVIIFSIFFFISLVLKIKLCNIIISTCFVLIRKPTHPFRLQTRIPTHVFWTILFIFFTRCLILNVLILIWKSNIPRQIRQHYGVLVR